jgi:hypothetical protein
MAAMVVSFGIKGSNGKSFSRAMRVSMMRKASETVNPIAASSVAEILIWETNNADPVTCFPALDGGVLAAGELDVVTRAGVEHAGAFNVQASDSV